MQLQLLREKGPGGLCVLPHEGSGLHYNGSSKFRCSCKHLCSMGVALRPEHTLCKSREQSKVAEYSEGFEAKVQLQIAQKKK